MWDALSELTALGGPLPGRGLRNTGVSPGGVWNWAVSVSHVIPAFTYLIMVAVLERVAFRIMMT